MSMKLQLFLFLLFFVVSMNSFAGTIVQSYSFATPKIYNSGIEIDELLQTSFARLPALPFKQARLLLPPGIKLKNIRIDRIDNKLIKTPTLVEISSGFIARDHNDFILSTKLQTNGSYLQNNLDYKIQQYKGFTILLVNLYPVYINSESKFFFSDNLKVVVNYNFDKSVSHQNYHKGDVEDIETFIDNIDQLDTYKNFKLNDDKGYDYLIISTNDLIRSKGENSLSDFISFLQNDRNLKAKVVDIRKILLNQSGVDNAQKLRNYIRKEYKENSPEYLLLVGDSDGSRPKIPVRKLFSTIRGYIYGGWRIFEEYIPSDFYYGCLDGEFNHDGDNRWGEPTDGDNGLDVDFLCEMTVGRWPVDNISQLNTIVKKNKQAYQIKNRSKDVLLLGELLFSEMDLWGGDYMNQLVGVVDDHGFISRGFDTSWNIKKLYDKGSRWRSRDAIRIIERDNPLMVNHLGHSNSTMNMRVSGFFYRGMNNRLPYFYYSQGCLAATFTEDDSIIEKMLYSRGGPFAVVANSTYGLGPEDPEYGEVQYPGTSQILNRYFINRVLNNQYLQFGKAHQKSKEDLLRYISFEEARWVTWGANYFGDPAIAP